MIASFDYSLVDSQPKLVWGVLNNYLFGDVTPGGAVLPPGWAGPCARTKDLEGMSAEQKIAFAHVCKVAPTGQHICNSIENLNMEVGFYCLGQRDCPLGQDFRFACPRLKTVCLHHSWGEAFSCCQFVARCWSGCLCRPSQLPRGWCSAIGY